MINGTGTATGANADAFVTKFNSALTALQASTFLGGSVREVANAIALNAAGNVIVGGSTASTTNFPVTQGVYQGATGGVQDSFISELSRDLSANSYAVSGVISDASGVLAGATVDAGNSNTATTDANGAYSLNLANGTYTLTVGKAGYTDGTISVIVNGAAVADQNLTLSASAVTTYTVSGVISDANGVLAGAIVDAGSSNTATTDANGAYNLNLADGTYTLTVSKTGFTNGTISVTVDGAVVANENLTLTVASSSVITGKYTVTLATDSAYTSSKTAGIDTMTVNSGVSGLKYFTAQFTPVEAHLGNEKVVFVQLRGGAQINLAAIGADFDIVSSATAGFNIQAGDVIEVYIVDDLTNDTNFNPTVLEQ